MSEGNELGVRLEKSADSFDDLRRQLAEVDETCWRSSCQKDGSTLEWLPLLTISESGLWLGLGGKGEWVLGRLCGAAAPSPARASLPQAWLTILDASEQDFRERLTTATARFGLDASAMQDRLPIDDVIAMALRSHRKHWSEQAVRWLGTRPLAEGHVPLLRDLASSRWATQLSRHAAKRLLREHTDTH
jgi:hypothetical protein